MRAQFRERKRKEGRAIRLVCSHAGFHICFAKAVSVCLFMGGSERYASVDVHFTENVDSLRGTSSS